MSIGEDAETVAKAMVQAGWRPGHAAADAFVRIVEELERRREEREDVIDAAAEAREARDARDTA